MNLLLAAFIVYSFAAPYPAHWWTPIIDPHKPAWEILPQAAKPGEVILSKRNELGILSNFAATPFTLRGCSLRQRGSAKGAAARRQTAKELADTSGGALDSAPVLRELVRGLLANDALSGRQERSTRASLLYRLAAQQGRSRANDRLRCQGRGRLCRKQYAPAWHRLGHLRRPPHALTAP